MSTKCFRVTVVNACVYLRASVGPLHVRVCAIVVVVFTICRTNFSYRQQRTSSTFFSLKRNIDTKSKLPPCGPRYKRVPLNKFIVKIYMYYRNSWKTWKIHIEKYTNRSALVLQNTCHKNFHKSPWEIHKKSCF